MGKAGGPTGAHSYIGILTVGYMNIGRGCVATHVYLESSTRKGLGICFIGECWVAITGSRTQSHPDYVMLESATKGTKVVVFGKRDLVDSVELVVAATGIQAIYLY